MSQKENDKNLLEKFQLKSKFSKMIGWLYGTIINPLVSFLEKFF